MNDSACLMRRPRQAKLPIARTATLIIATGALALLAAACSRAACHPAAHWMREG